MLQWYIWFAAAWHTVLRNQLIHIILWLGMLIFAVLALPDRRDCKELLPVLTRFGAWSIFDLIFGCLDVRLCVFMTLA